MDAYGLNTSSLFLPKTTTTTMIEKQQLEDDSCPTHDDAYGYDGSDSGSLFVTTSSHYQWLQLGILTTTVYAAVYYNYDGRFLGTLTNKRLAYFGLALSVFSFIPFLAYAINGIAWTGLELGDIHRVMIDHRHAVLMFSWVGLSMIQLLFYLTKQQKLHNLLGKFLMTVLLPIIFVELGINASFVFVPEKPALAWKALVMNNSYNKHHNHNYYNVSSGTIMMMNPLPSDHDPPYDRHPQYYYEDLEPTVATIIAFMFAGAMALLTPLHMIMYWWLAWTAIAPTTPTPTPTSSSSSTTTTAASNSATMLQKEQEENKKDNVKTNFNNTVSKDDDSQTTTTTSTTTTTTTNSTSSSNSNSISISGKGEKDNGKTNEAETTTTTTTADQPKPKPTPKKDLRLHVIYSSLLMTTMSGAGILRWFIQREFKISGCTQQDTSLQGRAIAALLQLIGNNWLCFVYPIAYLGLYCCVPLKTRQTNRSLQYAFWFHFLTSTFLGPFASYLLEIPGSIACHDVLVPVTN